MRPRLILMGSLVVVMTLCSNAFAWGPDGHRTVCQIAFLQLDAKQQAEITRLTKLYKTPDGQKFASFADGCTFPDDARDKARKHATGFDRFGKFEHWHFLNLPRTAPVATVSSCAHDCVLEGIDYHSEKLHNPATSDADRAEALFFLGHWVGDIHQPLHVSYKDDLGGNTITPIKGVYTSPHLHSVWDSGIITKDRGLATVSAFATRLANTITPAEKSTWLTSTPIDWAEESYAITISPDVEYCKEVHTATGTSCDPDHPTAGRTLTASYQTEFQDKVETRLEQAGVRLAALIRSNLPTSSTVSPK